MFRLFSKLFSKKSVSEPQEIQEATQTSESQSIPFKHRFKDFFINAISKIRFWFYVFLCIFLISALFITFHLYTQKITKTSIESAQAVMVNVITDQVFIGALYKDPKNPKEEPSSTLTDKEVIDNTTQNSLKEPEQAIIKSNDGAEELTNAQKYRAKALCEENEKKARISIIITGLGLSKNQTLEVLEDKHKVTLGFSPYVRDVDEWIDKAVGNGYEVMLNLPMQPLNYQSNDPGVYAMLLNLSTDENLDRLNNLISKSNKIIGFYTQPGEAFSSSKENVIPILERLSQEKFLFLYNNIQNKSTMESLCKQHNLNCLYTNHFAHDEINEEKIYKELQSLEAEALKTGYSIGYLNGYPITLKVMKKWLTSLDNNKFKLVPLSNVLSCPFANNPIDTIKDGKD